MSNQHLPEKLQHRYQVQTVDEMWHKLLTEGNVRWRKFRHVFGLIPSNPRCVNCHRPFAVLVARCCDLEWVFANQARIPGFARIATRLQLNSWVAQRSN